MAAPTPFLSAGLPGLTFGLSLGRGMSIQLDQSGVNTDEEQINPEEDVALVNNVTLPSGMLAIHLHAVYDLFVQDYSDIIVYASFSIGAVRKVSSQQEYNMKTNQCLFNEMKMIPFVVSQKPIDFMNKLVIVVYGCRPGEEHAVSVAKHKTIGRYEIQLHKLLKNISFTEKVVLLSKKGINCGQIEFECCVSYGSFGYGQSYQMKNSINMPRDLVKTSLLPRISPNEDDLQAFRGTSIYPRKLKHPDFIPLNGQPVENFEPEISKTKGKPELQCPTFPLLKQHMQRIKQLRATFEEQPTRTKRIYFLRKLLQDVGGKPSDDFEEAGTDDGGNISAPIPPSLALLINATKCFSDAPGIVERRRDRARPSLPAHLLLSVEKDKAKEHVDEPPMNTTEGRPRSHSMLLPDATASDVTEMKDLLFTRRRQSIAPNQSRL